MYWGKYNLLKHILIFYSKYVIYLIKLMRSYFRFKKLIALRDVIAWRVCLPE